MNDAARIADSAPDKRILRMQDPGAHSATAPKPSAAASATVHGAKAKPAYAGAGA
ncbi:hypothetical protein [Roseomonas fluvialis]|uniref:Uncharacterized protein n=1 Tax=Roseomonas fluvialis TaxID=1750527 RepID=A0ABM7YA39_9PROT|nr:hypothetical protein [Roseomonas fluvialis]BDG74907.1 hypothetical protein Rmf_48360 [Roseomonas fluvialis]